MFIIVNKEKNGQEVIWCTRYKQEPTYLVVSEYLTQQLKSTDTKTFVNYLINIDPSFKEPLKANDGVPMLIFNEFGLIKHTDEVSKKANTSELQKIINKLQCRLS